MKRLLLIVVVAALALTLVPLAVAGGPGGGGKKRGHAKFNLVGTVVLVTVAEPAAEPATEPATPESLTIKVKAGSHIKGLKGAEAPFALATDLKVRQLTEDGAVPATLADLVAGDRVKVKGTIAVVGSERVYAITCIKYRDLSPDVEPTPDPSPPPAEI